MAATALFPYMANSDLPLSIFGLEQPRCAGMLSEAQRVLLEASFGADNP
jgi:hypothetical protein